MTKPSEGYMYKVVAEDIFYDVIGKFLEKGADYGDSWRLLGAKGQFSDINRKFWKLYNSIWLGQELQGEQMDECVQDIIGHCLILLYILRYEPAPEGALFSSPPQASLHHVAPADTVSLPEDERRCKATVENVAGNPDIRCDLYMGHPRQHLANTGTIHQYQWEG